MIYLSIEFIEEIMIMYLNGASIYDICIYVGTSDKEINEVIDTYAPLL